MINCYSGIATGKQRPIGEEKAGLSPDGALEEREEDVRDGLNGTEGEWIPATVHPGVEGEGAGLALRDIGGAEEVRCGGEKRVTVVVAEEEWVIKHES